MNINELKVMLENLIHSLLYKSSKLTKKEENTEKDIINYLQNSENLIEDLRLLMSTKTNENYFMYDNYLKEFLINLKEDQRKHIIYNQDDYEEIIKDESILLALWDTLSNGEKLNYLKEKKKYNDIDIAFINSDLNNTNLKDSEIISAIINNNDILNKIPNYSIDLN